MVRYNGPADIVGGGSFVKENRTGWEIYNFKNYDGKAYGYVQPSGDNIYIDRIGATKVAATIGGVLVIFIAKHPQYGGLYVTDWYRNVLLYRSYQEKPLPGRRVDNRIIGYYTEADFENVRLLTPDKRIGFIDLPCRLPFGSGWRGRSNVWFAEHGEGERLKLQTPERIDEYESQTQQSRRSHQRVPPPADIRNKMEADAVDCVIKLFRGKQLHS